LVIGLGRGKSSGGWV